MNQKSFTLVELLVVVAIIILLSAIILPNYRAAATQFALERSAHKMAQDIRRAAEMAMSAKECTHPTVCPGGGVPTGGYGIYFNQSEPDSYIIYADKSAPNERRNPTGNEDIDTILIEKGVIINSVSPAQVSINFKPPAPKISLKDNVGSDNDNVENVEIEIALKDDLSKKKIIKVNKAGLIDVE